MRENQRREVATPPFDPMLGATSQRVMLGSSTPSQSPSYNIWDEALGLDTLVINPSTDQAQSALLYVMEDSEEQPLSTAQKRPVGTSQPKKAKKNPWPRPISSLRASPRPAVKTGPMPSSSYPMTLSPSEFPDLTGSVLNGVFEEEPTLIPGLEDLSSLVQALSATVKAMPAQIATDLMRLSTPTHGGAPVLCCPTPAMPPGTPVTSLIVKPLQRLAPRLEVAGAARLTATTMILSECHGVTRRLYQDTWYAHAFSEIANNPESAIMERHIQQGYMIIYPSSAMRTQKFAEYNRQARMPAQLLMELMKTASEQLERQGGPSYINEMQHTRTSRYLTCSQDILRLYRRPDPPITITAEPYEPPATGPVARP